MSQKGRILPAEDIADPVEAENLPLRVESNYLDTQRKFLARRKERKKRLQVKLENLYFTKSFEYYLTVNVFF